MRDIWHYRPGDKWSILDLEAVKGIIAEDLQHALNDLVKYEPYRKYGLPGFPHDQRKREREVEDAGQSVINITKAIEEHGK